MHSPDLLLTPTPRLLQSGVCVWPREKHSTLSVLYNTQYTGRNSVSFERLCTRSSPAGISISRYRDFYLHTLKPHLSWSYIHISPRCCMLYYVCTDSKVVCNKKFYRGIQLIIFFRRPGCERQTGVRSLANCRGYFSGVGVGFA